jgi:hypothetical protein
MDVRFCRGQEPSAQRHTVRVESQLLRGRLLRRCVLHLRKACGTIVVHSLDALR